MHKGETRKQQALRKSAIAAQMSRNINDADKITQTLSALLEFNATKARELIKNPCDLRTLINKETGLTCIYAMHAIAFALVGENCAEILNEMTDAGIAILKQCISDAKKIKRPNIDSVEMYRSARLEMQKTHKNIINTETGETREMTSHEIWVNDQELKSLFVYTKVYDWWDDAVVQLDIWSNAIDNFVRTVPEKIEQQPQQMAPAPAPVATESAAPAKKLLSTDELMKLLGIKKGKFQQTNRQMTKEQDTIWFTCRRGVNRKFRVKFLEEYTAWFKSVKVPAQKTSVKPVAKQPRKISNMLDVKALEAALAAIVEMGKNSGKELNTATSMRKAVQDAIFNETDEDKIAKLSAELTHTNDIVKEKKSVYEQFNRANDLYTKLCRAQKSLNNIANEVSMFIESVKQK